MLHHQLENTLEEVPSLPNGLKQFTFLPGYYVISGPACVQLIDTKRALIPQLASRMMASPPLKKR